MPRQSGTRSTVLTPQALAKEINKKFGAGTMTFASDPELLITRIPCGILSVDTRMGGGFPRGRHCEIHGVFSVGKTYLAQCLVAQVQAMGLGAAWVDCEDTFDPVFAESCGVDTETLAYHKQEHGHKAVDFMETLLRSGLYHVIVLDSIAALLPKAEHESSMSDSSMGTEQARLMSKALRKLTAANKHKTIIVYINQQREAVGVMFGKRTVTSGGRAMGFYAGVRLELARTENIKKKKRTIEPATGNEKLADVVTGHRVLMRIEKDKTGGGVIGATTSFVFDYDIGGVDPIEDLIYLGRVYDIIKKNGAQWWVEGYEDEREGSRSKFKRWLKRNVAVQEELEDLIRAHAEGAFEDEQEDEYEEDFEEE